MNKFNGEQLNLTKITRNEMGAYLCIATNGVPPTVSKRITVDVECEFVEIRMHTHTRAHSARIIIAAVSYVTNMRNAYSSRVR